MSKSELNPHYLKTVFKVETILSVWPAQFAVITAHNPEGISYSPADNHKFDNGLSASLEQKKLSHFRVIGASPDFTHAEAGFAVVVNVQTALELAKCWKQEAIYWIEDGMLSVISQDGSQRIALGKWISRII